MWSWPVLVAVHGGLVVCGVAVVVPLRLQVVRVTGVTSCCCAEHINKYDERRPMSSFVVWCHISASNVAPHGVNKERMGVCYTCLPGLGTTSSPSALLLHCGRHSMAVGDGLHRRWWWWEGRSDVAMFEPLLPHLG